jgi:hypothetical protein
LICTPYRFSDEKGELEAPVRVISSTPVTGTASSVCAFAGGY